jgi:hypothetical protein
MFQDLRSGGSCRQSFDAASGWWPDVLPDE